MLWYVFVWSAFLSWIINLWIQSIHWTCVINWFIYDLESYWFYSCQCLPFSYLIFLVIIYRSLVDDSLWPPFTFPGVTPGAGWGSKVTAMASCFAKSHSILRHNLRATLSGSVSPSFFFLFIFCMFFFSWISFRVVVNGMSASL